MDGCDELRQWWSMHPKAYSVHEITVLECENYYFLVLRGDGIT
jgi:hypothetical protein